MMRFRICALGLAMLTAAPAMATTYVEVVDTGETLAAAQNASGADVISGTLTAGNIDDIDLYKIFVADTAAFSVTVNSTLSVDNDAQLFLFDSAGQLVLADDDSGIGYIPQFNAGQLSGSLAGTYYLAYNLYNTDPTFSGSVLSGWGRNPAPNQSGAYSLTITGAETGAVPEPGTWAMMLIGFGAVCYSLRRRKSGSLQAA